MVMDLQRIESRVMRAVLDSLGQAMFPRTRWCSGQANMADVRQTAIGSDHSGGAAGRGAGADQAVHRARRRCR